MAGETGRADVAYTAEVMSWKARVMDERAGLEHRLQRLISFIESPRFDKLTDVDQRLLSEQFRYMRDYYETLGKRIIRFNVEE